MIYSSQILITSTFLEFMFKMIVPINTQEFSSAFFYYTFYFSLFSIVPTKIETQKHTYFLTDLYV